MSSPRERSPCRCCAWATRLVSSTCSEPPQRVHKSKSNGVSMIHRWDRLIRCLPSLNWWLNLSGHSRESSRFASRPPKDSERICSTLHSNISWKSCGIPTSSVIVSLRSPTYFMLAMTSTAAVLHQDAEKWSLPAMSYIFIQGSPHSSNKQYHSPFSSVVERGTCTIAQACRGHSFNPGRGQSRFTFDLLKGSTPHA